MESEKKWYESKTIIASVISGAVALAVGLRLLPSEALTEKDALINNVYAVLGAVASMVAIYGRITAKKSITNKKGN